MPELTPALTKLVVASAPDATGPGVVLGVVLDGVSTTVVARGLASLEHQVALTADTVLHVASISKQFTAYAVALLAEDGLLDLDDPVSAHLRWFPFDDITVRHLVHHTSGLRDQWDLVTLSGRFMEDVISTDDIVRLVRAQRTLNFAPGSRFMYCNTGYTLLGLLVTQVTGKSLPDFSRERIFAPVAMTHTLVRDDLHAVTPGRADSYSRGRDDRWRRQVLNYSNAGATSLNTTVADLARWVVHAMSPAARARLEQRFSLADGTRIDYAFGVAIAERDGRRTVHHSGSDAGYRAQLIMIPERGAAAIALSNYDDVPVAGLAADALALGLGEPAEPTAAPEWEPDPAALAALLGVWVQYDFGEVYEFARDADTDALGLRVGPVEPAVKIKSLSPAAPGRLRTDDGHLIDVSSPHRPAVCVEGPGLVPLRRLGPSRPQRPGTFHSSEFDALVHIESDDAGLWLVRATWGRCRLLPAGEDVFLLGVPDPEHDSPIPVVVDFAADGSRLHFNTPSSQRVRFDRVEFGPAPRD